jgi:hypothetical protein
MVSRLEALARLNHVKQWQENGIRIVLNSGVDIPTQWPTRMDPKVVEVAAVSRPGDAHVRTSILLGHRTENGRPAPAAAWGVPIILVDVVYDA